MRYLIIGLIVLALAGCATTGLQVNREPPINEASDLAYNIANYLMFR